MVTQRAEEDVLWFLQANTPPKADELHKASEVNVSYSDPTNQVYVSVSGIAKTLHDPSKIHALWNAGAQRWFPAGLGTQLEQIDSN